MKSVVMEIKNNQAILLQDDGQFATVTNRGYSIGEIIMKQKPTVRKRLYAMAATAAAVVLLATAGVVAYVTPYYHVSVDVNPGIMMQANWFKRVIYLEAANEDAKTITAEIRWKNRNIEEVVNTTLNEIEDQGYFQQDADVLIATASRNYENATQLAETLTEAAQNRHMENVRISSHTMGVDNVREAKNFGMTPGKYNLVTHLLGESVDADNAETFRNRSVNDLMAEFTRTQNQNMNEAAHAAGPENGEMNQNSNGTENSSEGKQFAEQKAGDAEPNATEQRQEAEQNAGETAQKATEQNRETNQEPAGETQRITEQYREPVQEPSGTTQMATEQNRETNQESNGTTQRNTEQNQVSTEPSEPAAGN